MTSRDDLRAAIFSSKNTPQKKVIKFFGKEIELRQPTIGQIQTYLESGHAAKSAVSYLTEFAYVPDTDEKVFGLEDEETLKGLPFNGDVQRVIDTMNELFKLDMDEAAKN